ncbi:hypothetical protein BDZ94DRAFT_1314333 [Collybia nuda]|uniref:Tyrosinase copper-binding domain-containing protein n=1 Tax=Collybia nuda TaxID=64659 RepID=A0A9P6CCN6_9AGAR|nr:hypothetical protein BDZ94DRAFT_1314333 [Collybia nuda]
MKVTLAVSSLVKVALLLPALISGVVGAPQPRGTCTNPIVRKEWRNLSNPEKSAYLNAVKCLQSKPAITPTSVAPGVVSRFEDLIVTHIQQTFSIHFVGHFLPWHRYMVAVYEKALRDECGLTTAHPYWDWTLDADTPTSFIQSPVFDSTYGFGGNGPYVASPPGSPPGFEVPGRTGGGCVADGPFSTMVVRMGPADDMSGNPRCLHRDFSPAFASQFLNAAITADTISKSDYGHFMRAVEGETNFEHSGIHGGGHYGVGGTLGEIGDLYNSPSDPLFYMHHANLDRVWWSWQKKNLAARLTDISGPINILDYDNALGGNVTLSFPLSMGLNGPDVTIEDVMDIRGDTLCYDYHEVY